MRDLYSHLPKLHHKYRGNQNPLFSRRRRESKRETRARSFELSKINACYTGYTVYGSEFWSTFPRQEKRLESSVLLLVASADASFRTLLSQHEWVNYLIVLTFAGLNFNALVQNPFIAFTCVTWMVSLSLQPHAKQWRKAPHSERMGESRNN